MARVMARQDGIVGTSRQGVEAWMRGLTHIEVIVGDAHFVAPATLEVGGRRLTAPRIFLDVGGRSVRPDLPGNDSVPTLDDASIMDLDRVPEYLVIVGGSYIGLEFAQMMRRFGAEVTVVERSAQRLPREDADVSEGIRSILENEGVRFAMGSECLSLSRDGELVVVGAACASEQPAIVGSRVLLAVGRRPNTEGLGLDRAGIETDARGDITVDDQCRTSADGVWAVGDCNGLGAFTHTSWNDHEIVVANLFDHDARRVTDRIACYAPFIDPARGLNGDEVEQGLPDLMAAKQPNTIISRSVPIHPTVSELLPTLLQQLKPLA